MNHKVEVNRDVQLPISIETFVRELLNNPPGLNGVELDGVKIGNKHVDHGWKAGLIKVVEFIEERDRTIKRDCKIMVEMVKESGALTILDEVSEIPGEVWLEGESILLETSKVGLTCIQTEEHPNDIIPGMIVEETFNPSHTSSFTTKGKLVGPSLFSMICLQDFKEGNTTPKKVWVACERPREVIHYDGVDYNYVGISDGRMFYVREGK